MTSFGWKRKAGAGVVRKASEAFEDEAKDEELDNEVTRGEVDWLTLAPKKRLISLEDAKAKSRRLREEGATLAEAERYWEAIKKWDEALLATPGDGKMLDMKAQALMAVGEVFPAVQTAQQAVDADPTWWEARQTLGRAQLNMGEVRMAVRTFCKAVMLNPVEKALWDDDLAWACSVKDRMKTTNQSRTHSDGKLSLPSAESETNNVDGCDRCSDSVEEERDSSEERDNMGDQRDDSESSPTRCRLLKVPTNYVHLRG